jgi:fructose-bisphosphate aldolase class I
MSAGGGLVATALAMVATRKGILAVDESTATCTKRFAEFGIESTEETRRDYREMMFTAPGIGEYVSGAILYDETIRQTASDGRSIVDVLNEAGIMPGIKVDTGAKPLAKAPGETVTEGLDGLRERLNEYREIGARFAKWRAVLRIGDGTPSSYCIDANAHALGRYAALAQEAGLVPIVEPEVLMDGDHDIERCREVTDAVLARVFEQVEAQRVELDGIVLKPNMVVAGMDCPDQPTPERVAELTLETLRRRVPESVPGITFLSGGMSGEESCRNLDAMNRAGQSPWELTYSFGRALQFPSLPTWRGKAENVPAAQAALVHRARMSSNARSGLYSPDDERGAT